MITTTHDDPRTLDELKTALVAAVGELSEAEQIDVLTRIQQLADEVIETPEFLATILASFLSVYRI